MPVSLSWSRSVLRRTENRLLAFACLVAVLGLLTGLAGWAALDFRQQRIGEAADRRTELTTRALDVYREMADADADSLNAVLVDPQRAVPLRTGFQANIAAATEALRVASAKNGDAGDTADGLIRELTDLLPRYARLVEIGWSESRAGNPVGTSYLANASFLVRKKILVKAKALHVDQTGALARAQRDAGTLPWPVLTAGAATLGVLVAAQFFVTRRTRRRVNYGLALASAFTLASLLVVVVATQVVTEHGETGEKENAIVEPLVEARNLGREADEAEVRILIFPKAGDISGLARTFDEIENRLHATGADPAATEALRAWREHDRDLLGLAKDGAGQPEFTELVKTITGSATGRAGTFGEQLDTRLGELIKQHRDVAKAATTSAKTALANWDAVVLLLMIAAVVSALLGLGVRIREYYT